MASQVAGWRARATRSRARALIVLLVPVVFGFGPCGPIAGTALTGPQSADKIRDWQFAADVDQCALEVRPEDPHSVTVNCWLVGGQLYVGCSECPGKTWSAAITLNSGARIQIGDNVYPVKATRLTDQVAAERAWAFRSEKYEAGEVGGLPADFWLFHLRSRAAGTGDR